MADTYDLLTLVEGYTAINDPTSAAAGTGSHDTELATFITAVSRVVVDLCGPVVDQTITSELHDGGKYLIRPRVTPVSSVTSITEYQSTTGQALSAETNASKTAHDYLLHSDGHHVTIHRRSSNTDRLFPTGRRNVDLAYVAGRAASTATVDAKFKLAASAILRRVWKREGSAWAQSSDYFGSVDDPAPGLSFFRAVKPMVDEFLHDELRPHVHGLLVG